MSETRPSKAETVLRRWPMIVALVFFLVAIIGSYPVILKHRFLHRLETSYANVHTKTGWIRKNLPEKWRVWLQKENGVDYLRRIETIDGLWLTQSMKFKAGDWRILNRLTHLKLLNLGGVEATDEKLNDLADMTDLEYLSIKRSAEVTDAGLVHLRKMKRLHTLILGGTKVTDAGVVHLEKMTSLKSLDLENTKLTQAGIDRLQSVLPNCTISY